MLDVTSGVNGFVHGWTVTFRSCREFHCLTEEAAWDSIRYGNRMDRIPRTRVKYGKVPNWIERGVEKVT